MKTSAKVLVSSVCLMAALAWSQTARAQIIFQTTFNCPDWNQSMGLGDAAVCSSGDGISGGGAWTTPGHPNGDEITSAANNPGGGGGKGFRHWVGDGTNVGGGSIVVQWPGVPEMWFRYYIRFQSGFRWGSPIFMKTIYCNRSAPGTFYFGLHGGVVGGHLQYDQANGGIVASNVSWSQMQGGSVGDGNFHVLEVHAKMNMTGTSSDGIFEFWLDGAKIYSNTTAHFSNTAGALFTDCAVGENHNNPQNGGDVYVDFDDIAVSTAGYIGPIGSSGLVAPKNLRAQ